MRFKNDARKKSAPEKMNMYFQEGEVTSKPWEWPVNLRGQWFSAGDENRDGNFSLTLLLSLET